MQEKDSCRLLTASNKDKFRLLKIQMLSLVMTIDVTGTSFSPFKLYGGHLIKKMLSG